MEKVLKYAIAAACTLLLMAGCSKTHVTSTPSGGGNDANEQIVEIIPAPGAVNLDEISDLIVSVGENEIYFRTTDETAASSASAPQTKILMPALIAGGIIYSLSASDMFPHGYLGKIKEVAEENGLIKAIIEKTTISESFDLFRVNGSFEMEAEDVNGSVGLKMQEDAEGFTCLTGNIEFNQEVGLTGKTKDVDVEGKTKFAVKGSLTAGLKVHLDINLGLTVENPYFRATTDVRADGNLEMSCSIDGTVEVPVKLATVSGKYIHPALKILEPSLDLNFELIVEGSAGYSTGLEFSQKRRFQIENADGLWSCNFSDLNPRDEPSIKPSGINFTLSGETFTGISLPFSVKIFGLDDYSATISPKVGLSLNGTFSTDIADATDFYNAHKNTEIKTAVQLRTDAILKFQGKETGQGLHKKNNYLEETKYIFPTFSCTSIEPASNYVSVWYNAQRDLLFPVSVGTALYMANENATEVSETEPETYTWIEDTGFDFNGTHTALSPGTYKVRPYVNLGPFHVLAEPVSEFEIKKALIKSVKTSLYYEDGDLDYQYDRVFEYDDEYRITSVSDSYITPIGYGILYFDDRIVVYADGEIDEEYILDENGYLTEIIDNGIEKFLSYDDNGYLKQCRYTTDSYESDGTHRHYEETTNYTYDNGNMIRYVKNSHIEISGSPDPDRNGTHNVVYTSDFEYSETKNSLSVNLMDPAAEDLFVTNYGLKFKGISSRCLMSSAVHTSTDGYYGKAVMTYLQGTGNGDEQIVIEYFERNGERDGFLIYDIEYNQ